MCENDRQKRCAQKSVFLEIRCGDVGTNKTAQEGGAEVSGGETVTERLCNRDEAPNPARKKKGREGGKKGRKEPPANKKSQKKKTGQSNNKNTKGQRTVWQNFAAKKKKNNTTIPKKPFEDKNMGLLGLEPRTCRSSV